MAAPPGGSLGNGCSHANGDHRPAGSELGEEDTAASHDAALHPRDAHDMVSSSRLEDLAVELSALSRPRSRQEDDITEAEAAYTLSLLRERRQSQGRLSSTPSCSDTPEPGK